MESLIFARLILIVKHVFIKNWGNYRKDWTWSESREPSRTPNLDMGDIIESYDISDGTFKIAFLWAQYSYKYWKSSSTRLLRLEFFADFQIKKVYGFWSQSSGWKWSKLHCIWSILQNWAIWPLRLVENQYDLNPNTNKNQACKKLAMRKKRKGKKCLHHLFLLLLLQVLTYVLYQSHSNQFCIFYKVLDPPGQKEEGPSES